MPALRLAQQHAQDPAFGAVLGRRTRRSRRRTVCSAPRSLGRQRLTPRAAGEFSSRNRRFSSSTGISVNRLTRASAAPQRSESTGPVPRAAASSSRYSSTAFCWPVRSSAAVEPPIELLPLILSASDRVRQQLARTPRPRASADTRPGRHPSGIEAIAISTGWVRNNSTARFTAGSPGGVGVEQQHDPVGEPPQDRDVLLGHRRAQDRDDVASRRTGAPSRRRYTLRRPRRCASRRSAAAPGPARRCTGSWKTAAFPGCSGTSPDLPSPASPARRTRSPGRSRRGSGTSAGCGTCRKTRRRFSRGLTSPASASCCGVNFRPTGLFSSASHASGAKPIWNRLTDSGVNPRCSRYSRAAAPCSDGRATFQRTSTRPSGRRAAPAARRPFPSTAADTCGISMPACSPSSRSASMNSTRSRFITKSIAFPPALHP